MSTYRGINGEIYPNNWGFLTTKPPNWFEEESDRQFRIFIIIFSIIGTVVVLGFISIIVCYCCAGCMLYNRRHTMMQGGGNNPGFVVSHQVHHRAGLGPPAYPVQEAQIPIHNPRTRAQYDNSV